GTRPRLTAAVERIVAQVQPTGGAAVPRHAARLRRLPRAPDGLAGRDFPNLRGAVDRSLHARRKRHPELPSAGLAAPTAQWRAEGGLRPALGLESLRNALGWCPRRAC